MHPNVTRCDPYLFPFRFWFHPKYLDQVCLGQKSYQYWFWEMSNGCPWVTLYMCSKSAFLPRMLHQGLHPALLMAPSATAEENFKGLRLQCKNPLIFFFEISTLQGLLHADEEWTLCWHELWIIGLNLQLFSYWNTYRR